MSSFLHGSEPASPWVQRFLHLAEPASTVLDVACGAGRHLRLAHQRGHPAVGVDRNPEALAASADLQPGVQLVCADMEEGPWPLPGRRFGAVIVTNYLWRPLWPQLLDSLTPGGVLLYETFSHGHASIGRPSRPEFLLQTGELLRVCADLRIVAFEEGFLASPDRFIQRICAIREAPHSEPPRRYTLSS